MPRSLIQYCEDEGLAWREMHLGMNDVPPSRATAKKMPREEIESQTAWLCMGEEGKRIQKVLTGIDPDNTMKILKAWEAHLGKKLIYPLKPKSWSTCATIRCESATA